MLRHISDTVMKENYFKCFAANAFVCRLSKNVYTIYSFQSRHFGIVHYISTNDTFVGLVTVAINYE